MTLGPVAVVGRAADAAWVSTTAACCCWTSSNMGDLLAEGELSASMAHPRGAARGKEQVQGAGPRGTRDAEAMGSAKKASRGLGVAIE